MPESLVSGEFSMGQEYQQKICVLLVLNPLCKEACQMSMTRPMASSSYSQLPQEAFVTWLSKPWGCSDQCNMFALAPGVMWSAKVTSETTAGESRPIFAHWILEQKVACISGSGNPLENSFACHWRAKFCFTAWPTQQRRQMLPVARTGVVD